MNPTHRLFVVHPISKKTYSRNSKHLYVMAVYSYAPSMHEVYRVTLTWHKSHDAAQKEANSRRNTPNHFYTDICILPVQEQP